MNFFKKNALQEKMPRQVNRWLVNTSVRWKLNLVIIILVLGFVGVFSSAYFGLQALQHQISNLYNGMLIPATSLDRADIALGDVETQLEAFRSPTRSRGGRNEILGRIAVRDDFFYSTFKQYKEKWATTLSQDFTTILKDQNSLDLQQNESATILQIQKDYDYYLEQRIALEAANAGPEFTDQKVLDKTIAAVGALRSHLRHLTDLTRSFAGVSEKAAQSAYNRALFAMGSTLIVSISLGLILAFVVSRSIVNRLRAVTQTALALQQGHLEERAATNVGGRDEIGQMAIAFDAMGSQLIENLTGLEQRVAERTIELEQRSHELADRTVQLELANIRTQKRAAQLQAISDVSKAISSVRSIQELLPRITELVSEQFGYYHVGIFLTDATNRYAVLSAANSEGGKRMLVRNHRLEVGAQGIVGYVTSSGQPRIALNIGDDAVFFNNPDLPETHSEMAIPLISEGKIIGALDIQSSQVNAFVKEDIDALSTLADQISIAIENARLWETSQKSLVEVEAISRQYLQGEWSSYLKREEIIGYQYGVTGVQPLVSKLHSSTLDQTLASGEISTQLGEDAVMAVPIRARDLSIGALNVRIPGKKAWKPEEIAIVRAIAERVSISVENARLFEESQRRALKEQTIGEISAKISSSTNLENVFRTAMQELNQLMPDTEIVVEFKDEEKSDNS